MVNVRDYQYKIIGDKVFLGIELEVSGESFYKNSKVVVNFIKNEEVIATDESLVIPMLIGEGVFCLGQQYSKTFDFDKVEVSFEEGLKIYEYNYDPEVNWEFDKFDEETRILSYKIKNTNKEPISFAILNLVFFNKGNLVCGTSLKLENLLNEREYYFEYQVPLEIEYTEIHPYVVLPATDCLLYKGFYLNYKKAIQNIADMDVVIKEKPLEEFYDKSNDIQTEIADAKVELDKTKKLPLRSGKRVFKENLKKVLKAIFGCIPDLAVSLFDFICSHVITTIILWGYCFLALMGCIGLVGLIFGMVDWVEGLMIFGTFTLAPPLIVMLICYLPYYIYYCFKIDYVKKTDFLTQEEKDVKIKEAEEKVANLENKYTDYVNNIDKYKAEVDERNQEIIAWNNSVPDKNKEVEELRSQYQDTLKQMLETYPEYRVVEQYDQLDFDIVDNAIEYGGYYLEDIEEYRNEVKTRILEERQREEERLRQMEEAKRQEELQQKMLFQLESVKSEVRYMQQQQSEFARQQLSYAQSQAYVNESINRKLGQMRDAQSISNAYGEAMYNKYH